MDCVHICLCILLVVVIVSVAIGITYTTKGILTEDAFINRKFERIRKGLMFLIAGAIAALWFSAIKNLAI